MEQNVTINPDSLIQRNVSKYLANKLGEEMIMMDVSNGDFVSLNNVGAEIWNLTEQPITIKELMRQLMTIYDISEVQCSNETMDFLQKSIAKQLFILQLATE